ncbi:MAG TPA: hypothetical protein VND99_03200 [Candidatus Acidoferrales bacterium]|nr:hypothetical protein [Candidatus Acidoferrales bacterium]
MAQAIQENITQLEDQALLIANEIFNLINEYTNDSSVSKFFLTDEIATACYGLTAGFTSVIYTPNLTPKQTVDTTMLSFLYALMTYGFNIYLKERSLRTNSAPYSLPYDKTVVRKAQKKALSRTAKGDLISTPLADNIIAIILENITTQMDISEFTIKGHRLNKRKFWDYVKLSLYWGYNFAEEILDEKEAQTASGRTRQRIAKATKN